MLLITDTRTSRIFRQYFFVRRYNLIAQAIAFGFVPRNELHASHQFPGKFDNHDCGFNIFTTGSILFPSTGPICMTSYNLAAVLQSTPRCRRGYGPLSAKCFYEYNYFIGIKLTWTIFRYLYLFLVNI